MSEATEQIKCPYCMELVSQGAKKCRHCGEILDPTLRELESLKKQNNNASGPIIVNNNNNNSGNGGMGALVSTKSRVAYIILAWIFGGLGFHNFYAGYSGRGIVQLLLGLTFFGLAITIPWSLIEIFVITRDANGLRFR